MAKWLPVSLHHTSAYVVACLFDLWVKPNLKIDAFLKY